jgi:excisionase family DNA binding protein
VVKEIEAKLELGTAELLITVPEAARRLGIGRSHVYRYIDDGRLRSVRLGRSRRIAPVDLAAFVARVRTAGSA